jgi:chromosome segregation ATPase
MDPSRQNHRTKVAIGVTALLIVLAGSGAYAMRQWKAQLQIQRQQLSDQIRAVEADMARSKKEQDELIRLITTYRSDIQSATGNRPTDEDGPIPGYKKQIREHYEKIVSGREEIRRIEKELSKLPGT